MALLEPIAKLRDLEAGGDLTARLAVLEAATSLPFGAVWDYYCLQQSVPLGAAWLEQVKRHEREVLVTRRAVH